MLTSDEISRVLVSTLTNSLAQLRHCSLFEIPELLPTSEIGSDDFPVDSIELLALATEVNTFFGLHKSGIEDYLLVKRKLSDWVNIVEQGCDLKSLTFSTSGSTGNSKQVEHQCETLLQEARYLAALLEPKRIISLVPCHHIYGFITGVLLPKVANVKVIDDKSAPTTMRVGLQMGDVCIGFPLKWRYFTDTQIRFPHGVTCVTSTAPCDPDILQKLQAAGAKDIIEVYGSTETAGVGFRRYPDTSYQLFDYWQQSGEQELTRLGSNIKIALMDQVSWHDQRHFIPEKRQDGAVQVAGYNVFPEKVARKILELTEIKECYIRLDPQAGRLKALLIPNDPDWQTNQQPLLEQVKQFCQQQLKVSERPTSFQLAHQAPSNSMGKMSDW